MSTPNDSNNRYAVVTGAARGIGHAITLSLLRNGFWVVVSDINEQLLAEAVFPARFSKKVLRVTCDVSNSNHVAQLFSEVDRVYGGLHVLVNNAGIQTHALVQDMTEAIWDETLNINLKGVFLCSRSAIPLMKRFDWGRIINISSMSSIRGSYRHAHYCASKAGTLGLTRALALEVGQYHITVNAVCPGIIETKMIEDTMKEKRERWLAETTLNRFGRPEDIADMVVFLASKKASWITGQSIHVNGGIVTP